MRSMSQSRKFRGYATEKLVAKYLSLWWPHALSTGAGRSGKDITGIPYVDIEVKARSSFQPKEWIDQVRKRTDGTGALPLVVCRLNGQGADVGNYLAFMRLSDLVDLLVKAGYDKLSHELTDADIHRCICGQWTASNLCNQCKAYYADL